MLKLERLELSGFKSFVDPVALDFAGRVTSIVGPNGCGKSNLSDAVVWVLGERSAKTLRGDTMEDVIFGGSANRKKLGMAEVQLTLSSDTEFEGSDDGRLTLGRRLYRDGQSQYLINGKRARLKEIRDTLMDTGLGLRAYSVIEQGKIGLILSGKPQERRRLIEEAAGITRYKERRRVAEIKLEEARANLSRLDDILSEVERALRSLKRQAGTARRLQKRQAEHDDLLRRVLLLRWRELAARRDTLRQAIRREVDRESEHTASLHREEAGLAEGRETLEELSRKLAERHRADSELAAKIEGKQEFLKGSRHRLEELGERISAGDEQSETRTELVARLGDRLTALGEQLERLAAERDGAASVVDEDELKIDEVQRAVAESEESLESYRGRLMTSLAEVSSTRNRLHREQLEREKGQLRQGHLAEELDRKKRDLAAAGDEAEESARRLEELERRERAASDEIEALESERRAADERQAAVAERVDELEARSDELERRVELLEELERAQEARRREVREALAETGLESLSFLAERLSVPKGWEQSLDLYLGELADAVVLPAGESGLGVARTLAGSKGTFRLLSGGEAGGEARQLSVEDPAIHGALGDMAGLPAELAAALPPAFLVASADDAERLAARHPGVAFIARERLWAQSGLVHVQGRQASPGQLAREHDLARLSEQLPPVQRQLDSARDERRREAEAIADLERRVEEKSLAVAGLRQDRAVAAARHEDAQGRLRRLKLEHETLVNEGGDVARELELIEERAARLADALTEAETGHAALEEAFDEAQRAVDRARAEREAVRTSGAGRRGRLELLEERLDAQRAESTRLEAEIADGKRQIERWSEESARLGRRREEIGEAMNSAESELQKALEEREKLIEEIVAQQQGVDEKRAELKSWEERLDALRSTRDELRERVSELKVERAALGQDVEHLAASYREHFDQELPEPAALEDGGAGESEAASRAASDGQADGQADARTDPPSSPALEADLPIDPPESLAELEADLERCRAALERIGPVNLLAAEEYDEQKERHDFLSEQHKDVTDSVASLERTIREINETSSERFLAAFVEVNEHFGTTFTELFRGGSAEMRLMDEDDPLESGIEIVARPPGKRLQNIMLMSGGEKALTAIALLFALFNTKPSPFCILDEVDAPLDDVNTLRFVELLKKRSLHTQFIVITHNKITMEAASVLYGVTMQERGVSNLVTVELDELADDEQQAQTA